MQLLKKRFTKRTALVSTMAIIMLLTMSPANAESKPDVDSSAPVVSYEAQESPQEVRDYWTKERMESAIPMELPVLPPTSDAPQKSFRSKLSEANAVKPPTVVVERALPTITQKTPSLQKRDPALGTYSPASGKVFFRKADNKDYVCSAAAINSDSKRMVATAGHCVHSGGTDGTPHKYWTFMPGYYDGVARYHSYEGKSFHISEKWLKHGNAEAGLAADFAFVNTYYNPLGQNLVDVVGGHGLIIDGDPVFDVAISGYPSQTDENGEPDPFDGERQIACTGPTREDWLIIFHRALKLDHCPINGGGSGGPWTASHNSMTGLGDLRSVSSYIEINEDGTPFIAGPLFNDVVKDMYDAANANP